MLDLFDEFAAIVDTLETAALDYAVCGGIAMSIHGFTHATVDIDLFVPPEQVAAIENAVAALGYGLKATPKIDLADGDVMTLDLLLVTPQTRNAWDTRETLMWRGRPIHVVSREGLISLKRFRSSPQDLVDIEYLESGE